MTLTLHNSVKYSKGYSQSFWFYIKEMYYHNILQARCLDFKAKPRSKNSKERSGSSTIENSQPSGSDGWYSAT